jgi:cell division protein FtsI/penicillin-binding protein 2
MYKEIRDAQNSYVTDESKRGSIFATFKNGELYPLAKDDTYYKLVVVPKNIDPGYDKRLYELLNQVTPLDRQTFLEKIKNKKDAYEEIAIIDETQRNKVEDLGINGVSTYKTYKRVYPLDKIGGRIIGFVGGGNDGYIGRYGLEKFYEDDLVGRVSIETSFFTKIFEPRNEADEADTLAKNVVTSLEPNVMKFLYKLLADMQTEWKADQVSAIVMKIPSGEIVGMETLPEYDPNKYAEEDVQNFINPSVQGVYELGSIMKPITLSGALDIKLITPQTVFHDYGFIKVDNYTIKNFDEKVRGDQTMQDVISKSLNTGAVYVEKLMGKEKFKDNFKNFGLEDMTNIDFPGEVMNKTDNLDTDTEVNFATAAFGQGVAITPVSMLSALSVIANGGMSLSPHFLIRKELQNGIKISYQRDEEPKAVVSSTTASTMKDMMVNLIDSGLANGRYKDLNYKIASKTGTAQLPSPDGKYYKDKFIHSYFTFFPADNPQFAVLIYQKNPKQGLLASLTLAPYATKIKDFLVTYYNIPPDRK